MVIGTVLLDYIILKITRKWSCEKPRQRYLNKAKQGMHKICWSMNKNSLG